jgi:hypothetical protein
VESFATFHSLLNYGFIVTNDSVGDSRTKWRDDGQAIMFWAHIVDVEDWKTFVWAKIVEAKAILASCNAFDVFIDGKAARGNCLWRIPDDQDRV